MSVDSMLPYVFGSGVPGAVAVFSGVTHVGSGGFVADCPSSMCHLVDGACDSNPGIVGAVLVKFVVDVSRVH